MAQPQPPEIESQISKSNVSTSTFISDIRVSDSVTYVYDVVSKISHSLKSNLSKVLVDIPV